MSLRLHPRPEQGHVAFCKVPRENIDSFIEAVRTIKRDDAETSFKLLFDRQYFMNDDSPLTALVIMFGKENLLKLRTENMLEVLGNKTDILLKENISSTPQSDSLEDTICAFKHPDSGSEIDVANLMFRQFDVPQPSYENLDQLEGFGLWFYDCVIPYELDEIKQIFNYCSHLVKEKYQLPFRITLHMYTHNYVIVVVYVIFNRQDSDVVTRAKQCVDEL